MAEPWMAEAGNLGCPRWDRGLRGPGAGSIARSRGYNAALPVLTAGETRHWGRMQNEVFLGDDACALGGAFDGRQRAAGGFRQPAARDEGEKESAPGGG